MTDQAHSFSRQDLVSLYADRLQSRAHRPRQFARQTVSGKPVHAFGRQPAPRELSRSRGKQAAAALVASAIVASTTPSITSAASYLVQPGDTLTGIAEEHGVSISALAELNGINNPDLILAGQEILIDEVSSSAQSSETSVYEVLPGDTLLSIADAHGVALEALMEHNGIVDRDLIFVGQQIEIPQDVATGSSSVQHSDESVRTYHLVGPNEWISMIAERYGVTVEAIAQLNGIENPDYVLAGSLLKIPSESYMSSQSQPAEAEEASTGTILEGVVPLQQSLSLSCESAAASIATNYWGYGVSEWVFIENMPYDANPHHGFRGNMSGPFGGTDDYGVYAKPLSTILANYGYIGEEFYTHGDPAQLKSWIDDGVPVVVWMTSSASVQDRFYEWHEGEQFTLVPQQHAVVAYGYDDQGVWVADPGTAEQRHFSWDDFKRSWSYFDGMSMAVYPKL